MSYCYFQGITWPDTNLFVGTLPSPYSTFAQNQLVSSRQNFNADPSVQIVAASLRGLLGRGYSEVTDWDTGGIFPFAIGHIVIGL